MSDDNTRYRVTRRTPVANRDTLRDVVPPIDIAAPTEELEPVTFPAGSRSGVSRLAAPRSPIDPDEELEIAEPGVIVERRRFGGHELVVEHRGDEVTVILPGAMRLTGSREEAIDLIRALLGKPAAR